MRVKVGVRVRVLGRKHVRASYRVNVRVSGSAVGLELGWQEQDLGIRMLSQPTTVGRDNHITVTARGHIRVTARGHIRVTARDEGQLCEVSCVRSIGGEQT